jgi:hypothetical protein
VSVSRGNLMHLARMINLIDRNGATCVRDVADERRQPNCVTAEINHRTKILHGMTCYHPMEKSMVARS